MLIYVHVCLGAELLGYRINICLVDTAQKLSRVALKIYILPAMFEFQLFCILTNAL